MLQSNRRCNHMADVHLLRMVYERGSSVVSAMASGARGPGFDPRNRRGKMSMPEHAFLIVICSDDTKNSVSSFGSGHQLGASCAGKDIPYAG